MAKIGSAALRWTLCGVAAALAGCGGGAGANSADEPARVEQARDSLQKLALAIHRYESENRQFPTAYTESGGKPLLSWRVAMLPALEERGLYDKFDQTKPWDSPENLPLLERMPKVFASPYAEQAAAEGKTTYLAARGPRSTISNGARVDMNKLQDGSANVLVLVAVAPEHAVEWTKPADWETEPQLDVQQLQLVLGNKFMAAFADASVHKVPRDFPPKSIKLLIDYADGKPIFPPPER